MYLLLTSYEYLIALHYSKNIVNKYEVFLITNLNFGWDANFVLKILIVVGFKYFNIVYYLTELDVHQLIFYYVS